MHVPSVLIPAECQHKILGCYITGIPVAVQIVRRHKSTRAGAQARGLPVDGHFHLAFPNEKQLFVRMPVRRMRRHAGRKFGFVQIQTVAGMRVSARIWYALIVLDCRPVNCSNGKAFDGSTPSS